MPGRCVNGAAQRPEEAPRRTGGTEAATAVFRFITVPQTQTQEDSGSQKDRG